jgi:spore maturation protein SpmA
MAALANPMVMLVKLRLLCVQLVPVKIVPIADATVSSQVEGIRISFCLIQMSLH